MTKKSYQERFKGGVKTLLESVKAHPVEIAIVFFACLMLSLWIGMNSEDYPLTWKLGPVVIAPIMTVAAWSLQPFRRRGIGFMLLYWLPLVLTVAGFAMHFLDVWVERQSYWLVILLALPLWMCVCRRHMENQSFVQHVFRLLCSVLVSFFVILLVFGLYSLTFFSVTLLFGIEDYNMAHAYLCVAVMLFGAIVPTLFFTMMDRENDDFSFSGSVILTWVLTPALLIYMVILYVYAAKILFTWNLPQGGVAYMIGIFITVVMLCKMLWLMDDTRPYKWFYERFSLFALPLLVLFWTGVVRRLSEYGLTEMRYYLLLCGLLMTLFVALFLFKSEKGFFVQAIVSLVVVLLVACVPQFSAKQMAVRSQIHRVHATAKQIGRLNEDGTLMLPQPDDSDTINADAHRRIYQSLLYLEKEDWTRVEQEFDAHASDYLQSLSKQTKIAARRNG